MKVINFCGVDFYDVKSFKNFVLFKNKKVFLFPSGPGLAELKNDQVYLSSLQDRSINFFDSGLFVLLLKLKNIHVKKFSGYLFIKELFTFLKDNKIRNYLFIEPSFDHSIVNRNFMKKNYIDSSINSYIAPIYDYNSPKDNNLLNYIIRHKPKFIVLNIGGGVQEKLAKWLKYNINFNVQIFCTGAAISFLTKKQAPVNSFIDKIFLGWLVRCIFSPKIFIPRYFKALKFIYIFFTNYKSISVREFSVINKNEF